MLVLKVGQKARIDHLAFAPDGQSLAAAGDVGAFLWRAIGDGERAAPLPGMMNSNRVQFTHDGRWVFVASSRQVYRFDAGTHAGTQAQLWDGYYTDVAASPVASLVLISQHSFAGQCRLGLWAADDLTPTGKVWEREIAPNYLNGPMFFPGGNQFGRLEGKWVTARNRAEYHVMIHDTATAEFVRRSDTLTTIGATALSPDARWLALRDINHIDLWPLDANTKSVVRIKNDNKKHFTGMAFHPSGRFLAVTSNDTTVKLYDTTTWSEARTFTWQLGRMRSVCFSPDGTLAAAGSDKGQVVVWDVDV